MVSLCGSALADRNLTNIVHDLALLNVLGVRLVIVFGARPQFDAVLPERPRPGPLRITAESDLPAMMAEIGKLRGLLEARFSAGLPGSPLHNARITLLSGNFVTARPVGVRDGVDHQFTGSVRSLRTDAITSALDAGAIVLLPPAGHSPSGQLYNLSAEDLAAAAAIALAADKLITFAATPCISDQQGRPLPELNPAQLDDLLADLPPDHADRPRLQAMLTACRRGIPRCQQVSYQHDGALLAELFTADGQGSQLSESPYRNVRAATVDDLSAIVALIRPLEQQGVLVRRSRLELERDVGAFLVAEVDDAVVGCCALFGFETIWELACVAVHPSQRRSRAPVGDALLAAAERKVRDAGGRRLFVLTTATRDWFLERGFETAAIDALPDSRRSNYDATRNAIVLTKTLEAPP